MRKREAGKRAGRETGTERHKRKVEYEFWHRGFRIFLMAVCGISESVLVGVLSQQEQDILAVLLFFGIFYSVLLLAGMEVYRMQQDWFYEKIGNYRRLAFWYGISCIVAVLCWYLPEFARPVLLLSVPITLVASPFFGMAAGIFHGGVYALCGQENIYVLLCYLLLLLCGCLAVSFLKKKEHFRWGILFLFQFTFGCVMIFSYLQSGQLELDVLCYGVGNGVASAAGAFVVCRKISSRMQVSKEQQMEKILSEDFGLVQAVRQFSKADYNHARKVSKIAANCAILVGADPYIAEAGGFYYRLGRMEGKPYVENGVALAKSNYLPGEIIEILREYNGEKKLPSTVESAIIHIVDSVVAKFEVLDKTTLSSSWNQDILVYQTLNENSAAGLYDKSGFSMNMFLKIRDYLIKEARLF